MAINMSVPPLDRPSSRLPWLLLGLACMWRDAVQAMSALYLLVLLSQLAVDVPVIQFGAATVERHRRVSR